MYGAYTNDYTFEFQFGHFCDPEHSLGVSHKLFVVIIMCFMSFEYTALYPVMGRGTFL